MYFYGMLVGISCGLTISFIIWLLRYANKVKNGIYEVTCEFRDFRIMENGSIVIYILNAKDKEDAINKVFLDRNNHIFTGEQTSILNDVFSESILILNLEAKKIPYRNFIISKEWRRIHAEDTKDSIHCEWNE